MSVYHGVLCVCPYTIVCVVYVCLSCCVLCVSVYHVVCCVCLFIMLCVVYVRTPWCVCVYKVAQVEVIDSIYSSLTKAHFHILGGRGEGGGGGGQGIPFSNHT